MYYKVIYHKKAKKFILSNKLAGLKFMEAFEKIGEDKTNLKYYDIKKYNHKNYNDIFRLRIGQNRAVFRIVDDEIVVYVLNIGSRGDIYKDIK